MKTVLIAACALIATGVTTACDNQPSEPADIELSQTEAPAAPASIPEPAPVEGWQNLSAEDPTLLDPGFTAVAPDAAPLTADDLRDRWTILAFWGLWSEDSIADVRYMQALRSAAGQDPDLDFRAIHTPPPRAEGQQPSEAPYGAYLSLAQGLSDQGAPFPTTEDTDGAMARSLNVASAPTYFLIGPDLAIEGKRGAIGPDNTDGVKDMIRGVAEIRRQIALPN